MARRQRTTGSAESSQQPPRSVERDYVAEVQRRVAELTGSIEREQCLNKASALEQRQRIEQEMAVLRAEAVKARRVAERIENLSAETPRRKRDSMMTESSTTGRDKIEPEKRRKADSPKPAANQLSFNPLHPSMELPPEQLIRLLGLETKKIRKGKKTTRRQHDTEPSVGDGRLHAPHARSESATLIPSIVIEPTETAAPSRAKRKRTGILLPSAAIGILIGLAAAGYLFWSQPPIATVPVSAAGSAPAASSAPSSSKRQQVPAPDQSGGNASPRTPEIPRNKPGAAEPAPAAVAHIPAIPVDPDRQAAVDAASAQLRTEAEQRFDEEMTRLDAMRETAAASSRAASATTDAGQAPDAAMSLPVETDSMDDPIIPDGGNQTAPESAYEVPEEVGAPLTPVRESSRMTSENLEPVSEPADDVIEGAYGNATRPLDASEEDAKPGSGDLPVSDSIESHSDPEPSIRVTLRSGPGSI